ncbi:MAG: DUF2695 domain-containing protein [Actinophytocola sp.]|nr:DUF2695 domain-containing protein [Actinophytocola sp.]
MATAENTEAESYVAEVQERLTTPGERECLACYVQRMLGEFGCDNTLRWALRWRDLRAPRATALHRSLEDRGGFCDCEVALNVYPDYMTLDAAGPLPECVGVARRGSTWPCRAPRRT